MATASPQQQNDKDQQIKMGIATNEESRCFVFTTLIGKVMPLLACMPIESVLKKIYDDLKREQSNQGSFQRALSYNGLHLNYDNLHGEDPQVNDHVQFAKLLLEKDDIPESQEECFQVEHQPVFLLALMSVLNKTGDITVNEKTISRLKSLLNQSTDASDWDETAFNYGMKVVEDMLRSIQLNEEYSGIYGKFNETIKRSLAIVDEFKNKGLMYSVDSLEEIHLDKLQRGIKELTDIMKHSTGYNRQIADKVKAFSQKFESVVEKHRKRIGKPEPDATRLADGMKTMSITSGRFEGSSTDVQNMAVRDGSARTLATQLSETELRNLADSVGKSWKELGIELGIESNELDVISGSKPLYHYAFEMLKLWRDDTAPPNQRECIIRSLRKVGRLDLSNEVEAEWNENETVGEKQLMYLSKKLGNDWRKLGTYLEVPNTKMEDIVSNASPNSLSDCAFKMLVKWENKSEGNAYQKKMHLYAKLKEINRLDLAEQFVK